jgi:hypothetical protein
MPDINQQLPPLNQPTYTQFNPNLSNLGAIDNPYHKELMSQLPMSGDEYAKSISTGDSISDIINDIHNYQGEMQGMIDNFPMRQGGGLPSTGFTNSYSDLSEALNPSKPSLAASNQPMIIGPESGFKRYAGSKDFTALGYTPSAGDEQEYKYGRNMTWGDTIGKAIGGGSQLAYNTFIEGWKGWYRMFDALSSWDSSKLMGSPEEQYQMAKEQEDIMNKYAIYDTAESKDSLWNRQFFGTMLQQTGFAVGAGAQFLSEELLTGGLGTGFEIAGLAGMGRALKATTTLGELANDTRKVADVVTNSERVTNAFATGARKIVPLYGTIEEMAKLKKAGAGFGQLLMTGLGGARRSVSEFNMARSESIFESAGTYKQMTDTLIQKYKDENNGVDPQGDDLEKIKQYSEDAAHDNFWTNVGVLSVMNRIQFDNVFKGFNSTRKIFNTEAANLEGKAFEVVGEIAGKEEKRVFKEGLLGRVSAAPEIAKVFGKKRAAWEAAKGMKGLLKFEASEGAQELIQNASNQGLIDYYTDLYSGIKGYGDTRLGRVVDNLSDSMFTLEGAKTFLMGALTGAILSPMHSIQERTLNRKDFKSKEQQAKEAIEHLNSFYENPNNWVKEAIANVKVQNKAAETMEEAAKNHNRYVFNNHKDSALAKAVASSIKLDMFDSLRDTIKEYGERFDDKQFKEAFGIDATTDARKNVKNFMGSVVQQIEDYHITFENLKDKYGDKILPELYKGDKMKYADAIIAKKALDDAIETLTTNVYKSRQAVKRASGLQTELSSNPNIGGSSAELLTKAGSKQAAEDHIKLLKQEIAVIEKAEGITSDQREILNDKKQELNHTQRWLDSFDELLFNPDASYSPAAEGRAYQAFTDLVTLFNKRNKLSTSLSKQDVDDNFMKLADYIKLNEDNKSYVDAMNLLADPSNLTTIVAAMKTAIRETGEEFKKQHETEIKKAGGIEEEEKKHTVVKEDNGTFTVLSPTGGVVADGYTTAEEANAAADELNGIKKEKKKPSLAKDFSKYYEEGFEERPDHKKWYVEKHLNIVQAIVDDLANKYTDANKDIMDLMVWTHDLAKAMNNETKSHRDTITPILKEKGYSDDVINTVATNLELMDKVKKEDVADIPIEVKILSTADALSHYSNDFLNIYSTETSPTQDMELIKESNEQKLEKDKKKILLPEFKLDDITIQYDGRKTIVSGEANNYINKLLGTEAVAFSNKLSSIKTEINKQPTVSVDEIFSKIAKMLGITEEELTQKYEKFQESLDGTKLFEEMQKLGINEKATQEEVDNAAAKYVLPKFIDFLLEEKKKETPPPPPSGKNEEEEIPVGKDNHDILALPSKKRKLTKPTLSQGESLVDDGKNGLFIIKLSNGEYEIAKSERNAETVTLSYTSKEQALAARDVMLAKETSDAKKDEAYYPFAGTEIRAGLILTDNRTGKQFVVDTKRGPFYAKADEELKNPLIKLLLLRNRTRQYNDAMIVDQENFSNFTIKEKVEKFDNGEPVDKDVFRLFRTNELSGIYPHRKDKETEEQAQERMDDFLKKTDANDIKKNTVIRIKQNTNITPSKEAGGKGKKTNPNLIQYGEKYQIQLVYNGEPIGYLRNYDTLRFIKDNGVEVPISDLTKNQFRAIFDLQGRGIDSQMVAFKNSYENSKKIYAALTALAKPGQEVEISKEQLNKILSFEIGAGEFDFVPKGEGVSFEDLPTNTIDGFYYILDRSKRYGSGYTFSMTENVITNAFGEDRIKIDKEVKQVREERDAAQQLGRYVAVVRMPTGRIRFIELNTDILDDEQMNKFISDINERTKETKEKNLQEALNEKKEIIYQRKKVDFNSQLNTELAAKLFISVPVDKKGTYIDFSVSDTGNLELTFYNMFEGKEIKRRKISLYGSKKNEPVEIKSIDDLISKINTAIEKHDKTVIDQRDAINMTFTRDNFKQGTPDVSGYDDIKKLKTNLTDRMFKNIPLSVKASSDLPAPSVKTGVNEKGVNPPTPASTQTGTQVSSQQTPAPTEQLTELQKIDRTIQGLKAQREIEENKIRDEKIAKGMSAFNAIREATKEATALFKERIEEQQRREKEIRNSNRNMAPKVVDKPTFDGTSIVNIDAFKKYVKRILGDSVEVADMDVIAANLKNANITVGRFFTYLEQLKDGREQIKGKIEVGEKSPFKYHEAFHAVFRLMLDDRQINKFLGYAKLEVKQKLAKEGKTLASELKAMRDLHTIYTDMSDAELENRYYEEYMADKFDEWKMGKDSEKILPGIRGVFQKIWNFIKSLFSRFTANDINGLFREIDRGKYRNSNIKENRFTKADALSINEPALKAIKVGEDSVTDENGESKTIDRFLPQQEGDQIASTVASLFHTRTLSSIDGKYNKKQVLNSILDDFKELYNPDGPNNNFYGEEVQKLFDLDPVQGEAYIKKLEQKFSIFNNEENREILKEAVDVHLRIMGFQQELEDDEFVTTEDEFGTRVTTDNWKETHSIGGFGSLSKFLRQYIAATTYTVEKDEFGNTEMVNGEPLMQAVNANLVYNGILKAVSNITDQRKFINRMLQLRDANTETGKFINKFITDTGLIVDPATGEFTVTNSNQAPLFQMVVKGFQQYTVDYIFMNKDIRQKNKISHLMIANRMGAAKTQFTQWQNAYVQVFESPILKFTTDAEKREFAKEKTLALQDLLNAHDSSLYFSDEKLDEISQSISNRLKLDLGIALSPLYIKFSIAASKKGDIRTNDQRLLAESYNDIEPMNLDGLKAIIKSVQSLENPFAKNIDSLSEPDAPIPGEEGGEEETEVATDDLGEGGNVSRLNELAKGNAVFDETVSGTSYKNAEGELVYAHQLPTFHLVKINSLNDKAELDKLKLNEFLEGNILLGSDEFNSLLGKLIIERIEGMKSSILKETEDGEILEDRTIQANQNKGITYGSFSDREFLISLLELYKYNKKATTSDGKTFMTSNHLIRVIEASNTGDTISLPVIKSVQLGEKGKITLSPEAIKLLSIEVNREFNRIRKVAGEIRTGIYENGKEIEGYHYAVDGDGRRIDKKPRGLKFYKMANMLGSELASELEEAAKDETFDISTKANDIVARIKEYWEQQIDEIANISDKLGVISISKTEEGNNEEIENNLVDDYIKIGFTKKEDGKNVIDEYKNDLLNIKPGNVRYNLGQILVNDYLNTLGINQILYGDEAKCFKNEIDQVKRARGANGSGPSLYSLITAPQLGITEQFTNSHLLTFTSPKFKGKYAPGLGYKANAQSYTTVKGMRYTLHGLGELTPQIAKILDKLEAGIPLTKDEIFGKGGLKDIEAMFNSKKLVYFDGPLYVKTSTVMLTKEFTSMEVDGKWVAIPGSEELHEMRERMEKFEKKNNTVVYAADREASKGVKANIFDHTLGFENAKDEHFIKQDTNYWRLQLVNPSNKIQITDPTQAKQIILAEQDDSTPVNFMGVSTKGDGSQLTIGDVKQMYLDDTAQRVTNNYTRSRDEIFNIESAYSELGKSIDQNRISPKLEKFQKRAIETLRSTGADSQLIDFFSLNDSGKPKYNLNNNITLDKYTQLFLAYFSKGVLSEKSPGHSVALMSNYGKQVVKVFTGQYDEEGTPIGRVVDESVIRQNPNRYIKTAKRWNNSLDRQFTGLKKGDIYVDDLRHNVPEYDEKGNIIGRYSEFIMPAHFAEYMDLKPGDPIPDHIAKMFGVRIPSQAKHSFISLRLVGFMPAYYGSTAIFPHELIEISGADFDIDKLYMHIYDTYSKNGERVPYGKETSKEGKFEEYVRWNMDNNKAFRDELEELKETNPLYKKLSDKLAEYKKLSKDADEFNIFQSVYFAEELGGKITQKERQGIIKVSKQWLSEFKELTRQVKDVEQTLISQALKELKLPYNENELAKSKVELNNGVLNNRILEQKLAMLTNEHVIEGGATSIAYEVASLKALTDLLDPNVAGNLFDLLSITDEQGNKVLPKEMEEILTEGGTDADSIIGKYKAFKNNKEGARNIGAAVNTMLTFAIMNNFGIKLRNEFIDVKGEKYKMFKIKLNGHTFDGYDNSNSFNFATDKYDSQDRIFNIISTLVTAMTDNAKERLAARLGLNIEALGYVSNMVSQGVPLKSAILFVLQPAVREYFNMTKTASNAIKTSIEGEIFKSQVAKELLEKYKEKAGEDYVKEDLTDDMMVDNIKNNGASALYQASIMQDFIGIIEQTRYFSDVAQVLKLTKGLGTSWEGYDAINDRIEILGLRVKNNDEFNKFIHPDRKTPVPFDLRQIFMGYDENKPHHFISKYIKISDQINQASRAMFLERTAVFKRIEDIIKDNFFVRSSLKEKFNTDLKRDLVSYLSIKAYRKFLADRGRGGTLSTMTNAMIYDEAAVAKGDNFSDIVDIMKMIRKKLPNNYIAKNFLNVIATSIVDAKGEQAMNPKNKDGINKVESNTWAKLSEYQIEKLRDSFVEIFQSDIDFDGNGRNGRDMANALFNYLLVKDGGQFRSGSFIKFIPNFMFTDLMYSTGIANDVLKLNASNVKNLDEEYKKVFGITSNELFNEFMKIYTTHVGNAYYVKRLDLNASPKFEPTGNKNIDDFEPKSFIEDGDKIKIDIFNGARIKEKQKPITEEEESEITWMDDVDYYEMLSEMTPDEKAEAAEIKKKSLKYTDDEKKRFGKNMEMLKVKGFTRNKKGEIEFPYIIKRKGQANGKYTSDVYYILKSVGKAEKQPKGATKKLIQPGETIASGVRAVYQIVERKGSPKTFKAGEMFDPIPDTAKVIRKRSKAAVTNSDSYNPFYAKEFDDPEKEELWRINHGFITSDELTNKQKKQTSDVVASQSNISENRTPKEILGGLGITFSFDSKTKSFKFAGAIWDGLPEEEKSKIKFPEQLVNLLGYSISQPAPNFQKEENSSSSQIESTMSQEKQKELGIEDMEMRKRFMQMLGGNESDSPGTGVDMKKREEFFKMMGINPELAKKGVEIGKNPLDDKCA